MRGAGYRAARALTDDPQRANAPTDPTDFSVPGMDASRGSGLRQLRHSESVLVRASMPPIIGFRHHTASGTMSYAQLDLPCHPMTARITVAGAIQAGSYAPSSEPTWIGRPVDDRENTEPISIGEGAPGQEFAPTSGPSPQPAPRAAGTGNRPAFRAKPGKEE